MRSFALVFSVRFFRVAPVHFSTEPFCVRSLARFFPWAFSQGVPPLQSLAWTVSIEFSQDRLQCTILRVTFWCIFSGASSVHIVAFETSLGSFAGAFLVRFFAGRLPWALSWGYLP